MNKFWEGYPEISGELETVHNLIKSNVTSGQKDFDQALLKWADNGGKMLRPAFYILASRFGDEIDTDKILRGAAAVEMIHMATLIHDDIVDEAHLRRGRPTIQTSYGKDYAVYMGDYIFCRSIMMMADRDISRENLKRIAKGMTTVCLGEINQYHSRFQITPDVRNYLKIIAAKTAALFTVSFYVGALEGGTSDENAKRLAKVGYNLGMAFQIIDDLLDFESTDTTFGKEALKDLVQGYYTLPLKLSFNTDSKSRLETILNAPIMGTSELQEIVKIVQYSGGAKNAMKIADRYTKRALKYLEQLPEIPSKMILRDLIPKLLTRTC